MGGLGGVYSPQNPSCTNPDYFQQIDGNVSVLSSVNSSNDTSENDDSFVTTYSTDDEVDPESIPANFFSPADQPDSLDVITGNKQQSSRLPLCLMFNSRSLYNKVENFKTLVNQIGPDAILVSETWERQNLNLDQLLGSSQYKTITYC